MTAAELAALEALANAATEGPWEARYRASSKWWDIAPVAVGHFPCHEKDAQFIAAARAAVPALIARVRELERKIAIMQGVTGALNMHGYDGAPDTIDADRTDHPI